MRNAGTESVEMPATRNKVRTTAGRFAVWVVGRVARVLPAVSLVGLRRGTRGGAPS